MPPVALAFIVGAYKLPAQWQEERPPAHAWITIEEIAWAFPSGEPFRLTERGAMRQNLGWVTMRLRGCCIECAHRSIQERALLRRNRPDGGDASPQAHVWSS